MAAIAPNTDRASVERFCDMEETLTLCFKPRKIPSRSLRMIMQQSWETVLKCVDSSVSGVLESAPVLVPAKSKGKPVSTKGLTGYVLGESSLFVSDTALTLKTRNGKSALAALDGLMDLSVPGWRNKDVEHVLKYCIFQQFSLEDSKIKTHATWEQQVQLLGKHFRGEAVILGSDATSTHNLYVANYLSKEDIPDVFSTQVLLTNLDTAASRFFADQDTREKNPLKAVWEQLHGNERRSLVAHPQIEEQLLNSAGYAGNAVFGRHFTSMHAAPQDRSHLSVETTVPMTTEVRNRFVAASQCLCPSGVITVAEFALCPKLAPNASPPTIPGFELLRSSRSTGISFACALHHYRREFPTPFNLTPLSCDADGAADVEEEAAKDIEEVSDDGATLAEVPAGTDCRFQALVEEQAHAAVRAAEHFLRCPGDLVPDVPVVLLDTSILEQQAALWFRLLPRVEPFYAVKCNPHPAVLQTLWRIWKETGIGGFDCASPPEIDRVISLGGVDPAQNIIFANPCKQVTAVEHAKKKDVRRLVFDNAAELEKLAVTFPDAELVLRVQTDDSKAQCPLSNKFGAAPADCGQLLRRARELRLEVVGVSFHVGSGCSEKGAFRSALYRARAAFDEALAQGYSPFLLDIGGGFPGWDEPGQATFADHAADICEHLEKLFPSPNIQVIAEPGRFFVATAQALLTTVVCMAEHKSGNRYYLNDGLYGSFNCLLYDHASAPRPSILRNGLELSCEALANQSQDQCTIFGPTCDGFDVVTDNMEMPNLCVGDRLLFPDMGAYTSAAASSFNGFAPASCFVYESKLEARSKAFA